jgi:hypothetical protein
MGHLYHGCVSHSQSVNHHFAPSLRYRSGQDCRNPRVVPRERRRRTGLLHQRRNVEDDRRGSVGSHRYITHLNVEISQVIDDILDDIDDDIISH